MDRLREFADPTYWANVPDMEVPPDIALAAQGAAQALLDALLAQLKHQADNPIQFRRRRN